MNEWVLTGLKTGIKSTRYPSEPENRPGVSPGLPCPGSNDSLSLAEVCPTRALFEEKEKIELDYKRCVHCFRCVRTTDVAPIGWSFGYEWADSERKAAQNATEFTQDIFGRSLHVLVVDAGDCGACLSETAQLSGPYYNTHRLGFFITPTPRSADVLLVVGPLTEQMRVPLRKAYDAMPAPKRVVAVGVCALSGGIFGPSFTASSGVADLLPVDVIVPGCPPPPLAILHALLVVVQRKPPTQNFASVQREGAPGNER